MELIQAMAPDRQLGPSPGWALLVALIMGLMFGVMAFRVRRTWIFPAAAGVVLALIIALFLSSLADADALPHTREIRHHRQMLAFGITILIAAIATAIVALRQGAYWRRGATGEAAPA